MKHFLKFTFGIALLIGLFAMVDVHALWDMAKTMHLGYAMAGLLCFILTSGFDMWRFWLASPAARHIPLPAFIRIHFESYIMAQLLPGHFGVDAYRIAIIGKSRNNYMEPAVILFGLRIASMVVMLAATLLLVFLLPQWQELYAPFVTQFMQQPHWLLALLIMAGLGGAIAAWLIAKHLWHKHRPKFAQLSAACAAITPARATGLVALCLGMIVLRIATFIFTLYAFDIHMPLLLASSLALCTALSWLLPLSPAGIGVREGVTTGLLVWLNVAYAPALAVALLNRVYFIAFALVGGISFLCPKPPEYKVHT